MKGFHQNQFGNGQLDFIDKIVADFVIPDEAQKIIYKMIGFNYFRVSVLEAVS